MFFIVFSYLILGFVDSTTCINNNQSKITQWAVLTFFFQSSMKGTLTRARTELNPEYLDLRPRAELNPEYWTPCTPLVSTDGPISTNRSL